MNRNRIFSHLRGLLGSALPFAATVAACSATPQSQEASAKAEEAAITVTDCSSYNACGVKACPTGTSCQELTGGLGGTACACQSSSTAPPLPSLVWQNFTTGEIGTWHITDTGIVTENPNLSKGCGLGCVGSWSIVEAKGWPNILWYNSGTQQLSMWDIGSNAQVTDATLNAAAAASWGAPLGRPHGIVDGSLVAYYAAGATSLTIGQWGYQAPFDSLFYWGQISAPTGGVPAGRPLLLADFNNDGRDDVLWYDWQSGSVTVWLLGQFGGNNVVPVTGTQTLSWTATSASGWRIIGATDVNGDGLTDLTWYNAKTGVVSSWLLDGRGTVKTSQELNWSYPAPTELSPGPLWRPQGWIRYGRGT